MNEVQPGLALAFKAVAMAMVSRNVGPPEKQRSQEPSKVIRKPLLQLNGIVL